MICHADRVASLMFLLALSAMATFPMAHSQAKTPNGEQSAPSLTPRSEIDVVWVGHSLIETKAPSSWGEISLMTTIARFAEARGLAYRMTDHTLWGASLSALWRGRPHGYLRDASSMVAKREQLAQTAGRHNALVLTEALPLKPLLDREYSAHYVRRFTCLLKQANPDTRVYLYQSWVNFQAGDPYAKYPPIHSFDWRAEMLAQRAAWEILADAAALPDVRAPGWLDRFGWTSRDDGGCPNKFPVYIVPVGSALVAVSDRIKRPQPGDSFLRADGKQMTMADLFANPYIDWPSDWPTADSNPPKPTLTLRHPDKPHDDIHPSALGVYVAGLVHFATLYGQSPVGLPYPEEIGADLARTLQTVAWETVTRDGRTGVTPGN